MKAEPKQAYVFQPFPPKPDGRFYGVGGLHLFGLGMDEADMRGITKRDAEEIVRTVSDDPKNAAEFIRHVNDIIENDWLPECGCRFESLFSSAVLLCQKCSEHPAHNRCEVRIKK